MTKKELKLKYIDIVCPTCNGDGKVRRKRTNYTDEIRKEARVLYRKGLTLREIGKKLNISHPQKVWSMINAKTL